MNTAARLDVGGVIPEWSLSDRLRKAREIAGLHQRELGADIDVSVRTVVRYEQGASRPNRSVLLAWALRTGVALRWLETGEAPDDNPEPPDLARSKGFEPLTFCSVVSDREIAA